MCPRKKHKNITNSQEIPLDDGPMKEKLNITEQTEVIDDIKLKKRKKPEKKSYIVECPLKNKNQICKDKLNILETNTLDIELSKISEAELITDGEGLRPFWNLSSQMMSKKLWSTQKIDCQDLVVNLSKTYVDTSIPSSQLYLMTYPEKLKKKNLPKTSYLSLQYSRQDFMERENIKIIDGKVTFEQKKDTYTKITKSIKFKPSKELKLYLNKCFGTHRYFYNKGVDLINKYYEKQISIYKKRNSTGKCCAFLVNDFCSNTAEKKTLFCKKHKKRKLKFDYYNIQDLRDKLIIKTNDLTENNMWQKYIPYDIKQNSLRLLLGNLKSAISNKKNNGNSFKMSFIKKSKNEICKLPSSFIDFKKKEMLTSYGKNHKFNLKKKILDWFESVDYMVNDTVTINKQGKHYYINLSYETKKMTIDKPFKTVSIDPGVRNFAAIYSPEGVEGYLGIDIPDNNPFVKKLCDKIDKLKSLISRKQNTDNQGNVYGLNGRALYHLKKNLVNCTRKLRGYIKNFHNQLINFLCLNFDTVIIGKFDPSKKIRKDNRKISSKTVRDMMILSHSKFLEKLKSYAERVNTNVIISSEEFTSKTCGLCGNIKHNLGSAKIYKCNNDNCSFEIDRDLNGARNIFIKTVTQMIELV